MKRRKFAVGDVVQWMSWGSMVYGVVVWVGRVEGKVRYSMLSCDLFGQFTSGRMYNRLAKNMDAVTTINGKTNRRNMTLVRRYDRGEI